VFHGKYKRRYRRNPTVLASHLRSFLAHLLTCAWRFTKYTAIGSAHSPRQHGC